MSREIGTFAQLGAKPGDIVRCLKRGDDRWCYDEESEEAVSKFGSWMCISRESLPELTGTFWMVHRVSEDPLFMHAPTGPVRTVTRKEIVPGTYGIVTVQNVVDATTVFMQRTGNAAQLRAAISILTEIADALEDAQ